jgi:hypothetical protein
MSRRVLREAERGFEEAIRQATADAKRIRKNEIQRERYYRLKTIAGLRNNVVVDINSADYGSNPPFINAFTRACNGLRGLTNAYFQRSFDGVVRDSEMIEIRGGDGVAIFWNSIFHLVLEGSDQVKEGHYVIIRSNDIPAVKIQQAFLAGSGHCVLDPLIQRVATQAENSTTESSKKRYDQIIRKLTGFKIMYAQGVPEDKMEEVAKSANVRIIMNNIVGNTVSVWNESCRNVFALTNTRVNHVEPGHITLNTKYESVTQDELDEIIADHDEKDSFYMMAGNVKNKLSGIRSARGAWAIFNPNRDLFNEFSASLQIDTYGLNAIVYPSLNEFVREGRLINSAPTPLCDEPNNLEGVQHIDVSKAYTQHEYAPGYKGFLGKIQMYCKLGFDNARSSEFLASHMGIFQFRVIRNPSVLLRKLGISVLSVYTLPGPEIQFFQSEGVEIELVAGCWGSTMHIKYTPEMLANRNYATWGGKLGMDNNFNDYQFRCSQVFASHLKTLYEHVFYYSELGIVIVRIPKKNNFTNHHIFAGITSYTRLNMLAIMKEVKGELIKTILDGLYFRGELHSIQVPHSMDKKMIEHSGFRSAWYYPTTVDCSEWPEYDDRFDGNSKFLGAGGCGKTTAWAMYPGLINKLFVTPCHVLGRKFSKEYGIPYTTLHKAIGLGYDNKKCTPYKESNFYPASTLVDENTMNHLSMTSTFITMHPASCIIIAGDFDDKQWYQCKPGGQGAEQNEIWNDLSWRSVYFTTDYRASSCPELMKFKLDVRSEMKNIFTNGGSMDTMRMNHYIMDRQVQFFDAVGMFNKGDVWLAGTHEINRKLLSLGIHSGRMNGKEVILDGDEGELRGAFTVHSFQGLTIPHPKKIFISSDLFEYAMLYTALSRATRMEQLIFVSV